MIIESHYWWLWVTLPDSVGMIACPDFDLEADMATI